MEKLKLLYSCLFIRFVRINVDPIFVKAMVSCGIFLQEMTFTSARASLPIQFGPFGKHFAKKF